MYLQSCYDWKSSLSKETFLLLVSQALICQMASNHQPETVLELHHACVTSEFYYNYRIHG